MPTTLCLRQAARFLQRPHHGVERVGDADDERIGRVGLDALADLLHDLEIDAEQVVAAHARLARHAGRDDDDVRARDVGVGVRALDRRIETLDGARLHQVEALAGRHTLGHVKQGYVAKLLEPDEMGQRTADHASADQRDFGARHEVNVS